MSAAKRVFLIAGEHSGDFLGAALMRALDERLEPQPVYAGVGGEHMEKRGFHSLFPLDDIAVMGIGAVIPRLPAIIRRVHDTVDAAITFEPDVVVAIDSQEFNQAIAKRIRRKAPHIPIIGYVSPTVWAWRPGRAKKMQAYIDHVLALLPFEPEAHCRLGGPSCSYVGHPLIEKIDFIKSCDADSLRQELGLETDARVLVVLPGSRPNEVVRLMQPFGEAVQELARQFEGLQVVLPVVPAVRHLVEEQLKSWPVKPFLLDGEEQKFAAFNLADAALAASGTVTLELALAKVPMVVAYKVGMPESSLRGLINVHSIVLANLVLGENLFPEFIQEDCTGENLMQATAELLCPGDPLAVQHQGLQRIENKMMLDSGTPAEAAAKIVISYL